jgi:flagellar hook-associated protein FlgK
MNTLTAFKDAPNGLADMAASLSNLFNAFQNLVGDPANFGRSHAVVRAAQKVAAQFNEASARLCALEGDLHTLNQKDAARAREAIQDLAALQNGLNTLAAQLITQVNAIYISGAVSNGLTGRNFFNGTNALDIAVNPDAVQNPAQLQSGAGKNTVAQDLAKLGGQNLSTLGNQTFVVSNNFGLKRKMRPASMSER